MLVVLCGQYNRQTASKIIDRCDWKRKNNSVHSRHHTSLTEPELTEFS